MSTVTLEAIEKVLRSKHYDAKIQKETHQVYVVLKIEEKEFPLFIRIYQGEELLQLLAFFPCHLKKETVPATARLLHIFNKELDIPGFGMDEVAQVVFFRCMIPLKNKQLDEALLETFTKTIELACKTFATTIEAVAGGVVDLDEMIKKAQSEAKKKQK